MRFRSYRGSRRKSIPRSTTRSSKYIVVVGPASEAAGLSAHTIMIGTDNATLGQTTVTDTAVPVGAKVSQIEIFMPKVNLGAGTANFTHWTIQRTLSGQSVINPITAGGSPLRKNIMLTGVIGMGEGQNNSTHIKFKIPAKMQRIGDGDIWNIVNNNLAAVSTVYYFIYKIFM